MSLKKDFLEEISVGDSIIVVYAQQREVTGRVLRLTDEQVCIQTEKGSPRILLDSIVCYDILDDVHVS